MERVQGSCCCGHGVGDHAKGIYQAFSTQACLCLSLMYFIVTDLHLVSMCKTLKSKVKSVGLKEHWGQKLNSCSKQVSVVGKIVFSLSQY